MYEEMPVTRNEQKKYDRKIWIAITIAAIIAAVCLLVMGYTKAAEWVLLGTFLFEVAVIGLTEFAWNRFD